MLLETAAHHVQLQVWSSNTVPSSSKDGSTIHKPSLGSTVLPMIMIHSAEHEDTLLFPNLWDLSACYHEACGWILAWARENDSERPFS